MTSDTEALVNWVTYPSLFTNSLQFMCLHINLHIDYKLYLTITCSIRVPVKCETKQKRNGTKRNRSKRNETNRNETKQIETKRNKSKRNETKRYETNRNETKQMIWQALVDKNQYFVVLKNLFLI